MSDSVLARIIRKHIVTEIRGQIACLTLEKLNEIRGVVIAHAVGYLLHHEVGEAQETLRLKYHTVIDEGKR